MAPNITDEFNAVLDRHFPKVRVAELSCPELPGASAALTGAWCAGRASAGLALIVTSGPAASQRIYSDFVSLRKHTACDAVLFTQEFEEEPDSAAARLRVVRLLTDETRAGKTVVIASAKALLCPTPDPERLEARSVTLKRGGAYELSELAAKFVELGYTRTEVVEETEQFAVRGGILDIWPPMQEYPCRNEFFDTELESIRSFDPVSQCSVESGLESIWISPCTEEKGKTKKILLPELLPPECVILWDDYDTIRTGIVYETGNAAEGEANWTKLRAKLTAARAEFELYAGSPPPPHVPEFPIPVVQLAGMSELGAEIARHPGLLASAREKIFNELLAKAAAGESVFLCADTAGTAEMLNRRCLENLSAASTAAAKPVWVRKLPLSGGFSMPGLTLAAQSDLYAVRKKNPAPPAKRGVGGQRRIENAEDLEPGDIVVHVEHGIGRFLGTTEIDVAGKRCEVFTIEYADRAKLHVPVTQAHLLGKYIGVAGHKVRLHKLGGRRWSREKAEATASVRNLAGTLLETQARRNISAGIAFNPEAQWVSEFEAGFAYCETADQLKAIEAVKSDMAGSKPMDRLICGDAGYGKTEVAMRSAFIAVMNGYQAAVLVPTTVLAEQHYETFRERMADFPVSVRVIDRFQSQSEKKKLREETKKGQIDILIGTHALLSDGIAFKNLGLLIIDEEQRFGVAHKEKLKALRQTVDVLTMSATPIPRTLYMSMTGAKDMSQLQTPPRERVAVETKIARDTDEVYIEAIRRELRRGGRCYVLHNRVATIELAARRLRNLVPEARIAVAHGQLPSDEIVNTMRDFQNGEIDVLLCTTIVESGLDIPQANTIIVDRADRFGIADLYQLRGRVGRAAQKGFAWLLIPPSGYVADDARERLAAVKKHSALGSGFNLALRDLEIRGAGNLLGREQSGQIAAVGFSLYCQLLKRTIALLKGERPPVLIDVETDFDFLSFSPGSAELSNAACVTYSYIEDDGQRMLFHRKLAEVSTVKELNALRDETVDRFGRMDSAAKRLFALTELRIAAAHAGLRRIETRRGKILMYSSDAAEALFVDGRIPRLCDELPDRKIAQLLKLVNAIPKLRKLRKIS